MFKFGVRIGSVAKLKVCNLLSDANIIFREKNNRIIKRRWIKETFNILSLLVNECELKNDDYFFFF